MTTPAHQAVPRHHLLVVLAMLVVVTYLTCASIARATPTGYTVSDWTACHGTAGSGTWDDAGELFLACSDGIHVLDAAGVAMQVVAGTGSATDVAPTRDGHFVYVADGGPVHRLVRQLDGTYAHDATFALDDFTIGAASYHPQGELLAVDGAGRLFLADGAWTQNNLQTVIVYDPNGHAVTRFGLGTYAASGANPTPSWDLGTFYWMLTGIAVTADGATAYTTEGGNNRVQVWSRVDDGGYSATSSFGGSASNNADRGGSCDLHGWSGAFAAPYDVSLDGAGNVYVLNTTCKQVLQFTASGDYITGIDVHQCLDYPRPHGFAVAADGTVYVGQNDKVARPGGPSPSRVLTDGELLAKPACAGQSIIMPGAVGGPGGPPLPSWAFTGVDGSLVVGTAPAQLDPPSSLAVVVVAPAVKVRIKVTLRSATAVVKRAACSGRRSRATCWRVQVRAALRSATGAPLAHRTIFVRRSDGARHWTVATRATTSRTGTITASFPLPTRAMRTTAAMHRYVQRVALAYHGSSTEQAVSVTVRPTVRAS